MRTRLPSKGKLNLERTIEESFDVVIWNCPHCHDENCLETDADGIVTCDNCGEWFRVCPVECLDVV